MHIIQLTYNSVWTELFEEYFKTKLFKLLNYSYYFQLCIMGYIHTNVASICVSDFIGNVILLCSLAPSRINNQTLYPNCNNTQGVRLCCDSMSFVSFALGYCIVNSMDTNNCFSGNWVHSCDLICYINVKCILNAVFYLHELLSIRSLYTNLNGS